MEHWRRLSAQTTGNKPASAETLAVAHALNLDVQREIFSALTRIRASLNSFKNDFPFLTDYSNLYQVQCTFAPLRRVNEPYSLEGQSVFLVVNCESVDDVHKSMKYGIWATDNAREAEWLSALYQQNLRADVKTVLLFRLARGSFVGAAELISPFLERKFDLWWDGHERSGYFELSWLFVKTLPRLPSPNITLGISLLLPEQGWQLLRMLRETEYRFENSLFSLFTCLDSREDFLFSSRGKTDFKLSLQKRERGVAASSAAWPASRVGNDFSFELRKPTPRREKRYRRGRAWLPAEESYVRKEG